MSLIKNISTVLASLLFSLLVAEVAFRILDIGYGNSPLERSRIYHHTHPANYSFLMHDPNGEYGGFNIHYDESGYRVADSSHSNTLSEDSENALLFMGDSFTEANQVPFEDSFPYIIGRSYGAPTLNFGVSSYSPLLYLLQVKNQVELLSARVVLLQIYYNDFAGDEEYKSLAKFNDSSIIAIDGGENSLLSNMARKSYLLRFVRRSQLLIEHLLANSQADPETSSTQAYDTFRLEQDVSRENLEFTSQIIAEIDVELTKQGKQLAVFMIPSRSLSQNNRCCATDELYARFLEEMQALEIEVLDVAKHFQEHHDQRSLFFETDIHLTASGHRLLAEALVMEIESHQIIN